MDLFGKKAAKRAAELELRVSELEASLNQAEVKLRELGYEDYAKVKEKTDRIRADIGFKRAEVSRLQQEAGEWTRKIEELKQQDEKLERQTRTAAHKLEKAKELYKSAEYSINQFFETTPDLEKCKLSPESIALYDELAPSVTLKLHVMDVKSLRKAFRDNDKQIESILTKYAARYTTKANQAIYKLMVIALRAELQNILYNLKYERLDSSVAQVKTVTAKYLKIASEGNQNIAGTMAKFIGEIEYLFINAVKIEYNYYVKKEQAKQEQAEIREKMRQEAAERKALEAERKKIEAEESKYNDEISRVRRQLGMASGVEADQLRKRILELEAMLSDVAVKRKEIANLQNGKAGNIYIISNLGSFGNNVFKIGMTRRLDPQDRIDELGSASVPFKFDVHSFIFSEDAVDLENRLHKALHNKRVNKVNLRKEFFYASIDELEKLVSDIDPTAEFNRTMLAEEFRQSQSTDTVYTSEYSFDSEEDNE